MSHSEEYRELNGAERQLLDRLLEARFSGRAEVAEQLKSCRVRTLDDDGCLEFLILSDIKANVEHSVPVEAEAKDENGNKIHMLLHVVGGKVDELEFYAESDSPITQLPPAKEWELIVLPSPPQ